MLLSKSFSIDALEPRRLLASQNPVAINFNDEALWDANFATSVAQAKSLGVTAVRLWFGFDDYNARPNAWDPNPVFGTVYNGTSPSVGSNPLTMERAFQLHDMGFKVLLVLQQNQGTPPTATTQVKGLIDFLMTSTETPTSSETLAQAVDYWEIGNEPDSASYWAPSGVNKINGLKSYTDNFLIPAAQELHNYLPTPEKVVSAGVSYSPTDMKTILDELNAQNDLGLIDYAGIHPYGTYDPTNASVPNTILSNTLLAVQYASAYGKQLMATEWNVRGFGTSGSNDAKWASAIDYEYKNVIAPNYAIGFYFDLINDWAARGGTISARPGGLLKHISPVSVTPTSSIADLTTYYNSPLTTADPFYSTFNAWQYGTVSGTVSGVSASTASQVSVYVDLNNNGVLDAGEPFTTPAASGAYSLKFSTGLGGVTPGSYAMRIATPSTLIGSAANSVALTNLISTTGVNFSVAANGSTGTGGTGTGGTGTIGTISGTLWNDTDGNGVLSGVEAVLPSMAVYLDLNGNGLIDANEPTALTNAAGVFTLTFDTSTTAVSSAQVRPIMPSGWQTTAAPAASLLANVAQTGFLVGERLSSTTTPTPTTPTPTTPTPTTPTPTGTASIAGKLYAYSSSQTAQMMTLPWTVFLDTNKNGVLDAGEISASVKSDTTFALTSLPAGSYTLTLKSQTGWAVTTPAAQTFSVTVTNGQARTGYNFIVKPGATTTPTPTTPTPTTPTPTTPTPTTPTPTTPTPTTPTPTTPTPTPTGTASVAGKLYAYSSSQTAQMMALPWTVFFDTNKNGVLDSGEISATVKADTTFALTNLAAGTYTLTLKSQSGWSVTTPAAQTFTLTVTNGQARTGYNFIVKPGATTTPTPTATTPTPTTPTPTPTTPTPTPTPTSTSSASTASLAGKLYAYSSSETSAMTALVWTVFLDTNKNGILDAGEVSTTMKSDDTFLFSNLAAGAYTVALKPPTGWSVTTPTAKTFSASLTAAQAKTGYNFVVKPN